MSEPSEAGIEAVAKLCCQDGYEGAWGRANEAMRAACRKDAEIYLRAYLAVDFPGAGAHPQRADSPRRKRK